MSSIPSHPSTSNTESRHLVDRDAHFKYGNIFRTELQPSSTDSDVDVVVSEHFILEIRNVNAWKKGYGHLLVDGVDFPDKRRILVLYGKTMTPSECSGILGICERSVPKVEVIFDNEDNADMSSFPSVDYPPPDLSSEGATRMSLIDTMEAERLMSELVSAQSLRSVFNQATSKIARLSMMKSEVEDIMEIGDQVRFTLALRKASNAMTPLIDECHISNIATEAVKEFITSRAEIDIEEGDKRSYSTHREIDASVKKWFGHRSDCDLSLVQQYVLNAIVKMGITVVRGLPYGTRYYGIGVFDDDINA